MMFYKVTAAITSFGAVGSIAVAAMGQPAPGATQTPPTTIDPSPAPAASSAEPVAPAATTSQPPIAVAPTQAPEVPPAAPVAAAPLPEATKVAAVESAPASEGKEKSAPLLPTKLSVGKLGWLQVGALLQGWYDMRWNSELPEGTSRSTQATFRARRAEIKVSGELLGGAASFVVSFDPASTYKYDASRLTVTNGQVGSAAANTPAAQTITTYAPPGNTAALKLFWVTLKSAYVEASIGQFKYPISYEGQSSSSELLFPERAISTRYFGDTYDMGMRLEKKFEWFKYQVFLLNGSGQNQLDKNLQKDLSARIEFTPVNWVVIGASGLTSLGERSTQPTTRDIIEAFGRVNKAGFLVQGELLWGEVGSTAEGAERTKAAGRYAMLGYTIAERLQPVVRYGYLNTDKTTTANKGSYALYTPFGVASDEARSYEVGLNYYIQGHALKLQAAYGYYDFDNVPSLQQFTFAAQAAL